MESKAGTDMINKCIDDIDCIKNDIIVVKKKMVDYGLAAAGSGAVKNIERLDGMKCLMERDMARLHNIYSRFSAISEVLRTDAESIAGMYLIQTKEDRENY